MVWVNWCVLEFVLIRGPYSELCWAQMLRETIFTTVAM